MTELVNPLNDAVADGTPRRQPEVGTALAMSGGGYRAMVFHLGALWRLYEADRLQGLSRISSVSGGSITAGVLALAWPKLSFDPAAVTDDFARHVVAPVRGLAGENLDTDAIIGGVLLPGSVADRVAAAYRRHLFGDATLQSLPDWPRFVINATNVQSGALWRFSKPFMGDYRVGLVKSPTLSLATAVAASSAFPPVLSPLELELEPDDFTPGSGTDLQHEPFTSEVILSDGGVYDNLGLETVWKRYQTILISDAGARMAAEPSPKRDWARHSYRVLDLIDNQVRSLRKRAVMAGFKQGLPDGRNGAYWSVGSRYDSFAGRSPLFDIPPDRSMALATIPTRLKAMAPMQQERLINWGYAVTDAALRSHADAALPAPVGLPYPAAGF